MTPEEYNAWFRLPSNDREHVINTSWQKYTPLMVARAALTAFFGKGNQDRLSYLMSYLESASPYPVCDALRWIGEQDRDDIIAIVVEIIPQLNVDVEARLELIELFMNSKHDEVRRSAMECLEEINVRVLVKLSLHSE